MLLLPILLFELLWWSVAICAAVAVFVRIQLYLNDPLRRQLNEEWYALFEAHQAARYRDGKLDWRLRALSTDWAHQAEGLK